MKDEILRCVLDCAKERQKECPHLEIGNYISLNFYRIYQLYRDIDNIGEKQILELIYWEGA